MPFFKRLFCPSYGITLSYLLFLSLFIKMYLMYFLDKSHYETYSFFFIISDLSSYFFSDLLVWIVSLFFVMLALVAKRKWVRSCYVFIVFSFLFLFAVDLITLYFAGFRLSFLDLLSMSNGASSGMVNIFNPLFCILLIYVFFGVFLAYFIAQIEKSVLKKMTLVIVLISTVLFLGLGFGKNFKKSDLSNIFTLNFESFFYEEPIQSAEKKYEDYFDFEKGRGHRPNIIFLFSESISAVDSEKAGGLNRLPLFDKISDEGIFFNKLIENGGTSDTAHISALLGVEPYFKISDPYTGYKLPTSPLGTYFESIGYSTVFISTVSLDFLHQRDFLNFAGFKKIIGDEAFKNKKTYVFDAAPDKILYDKILEEVENKSQTSQPFFIGSQTISLHTPFDTPYGKSEDDALQYVDRAFSNFYESLLEMGYFESGILVVLGDHKKNVPLTEQDKKNMGATAQVQSLGLVIGTGIEPGIMIDTPVQPTDFFYSLKQYTSTGEVLLKNNYNPIFDGKQRRNWTLTTMSYDEFNKYHFFVFSGDTVEILKSKDFALDEKDEKIEYLSAYLGYQLGTAEISNLQGTAVIGYHGGGNLAQENSIEGFYVAKKLQLPGIEFEVSYTKDQVNILSQGPTLWPSSCPKTHIYDKTYTRLKDNCTLKNGEKVMPLESVLNLIDGFFQYYFLYLKADEDEKRSDKIKQTKDAIKLVKQKGMEDKVIFLSDDPTMRELLLSSTGVILGRDTDDVDDFQDESLMENSAVQYFLFPYDLMTDEVIENLHDAHKKVVLYPLDQTGSFEQGMDAGVDFVFSNEPQILQSFLKKESVLEK